MKSVPDLQIATLSARYRAGSLTAAMLVEQLESYIGNEDPDNVWIQCLDSSIEQTGNACLYKKSGGSCAGHAALYGIPFSINDNIDLAGIPTTGGCPEYTYTPEKSATVVQKQPSRFTH